MTFDEYQAEAQKTAIYPDEYRIVYPALGLNGEAGEVAEKIKKVLRDGKGYSPNVIDDLEKEIGDVLWYVAAVCRDLGINMNDAAEKNIAKLRSRQERGVLQGSGDNR